MSIHYVPEPPTSGKVLLNTTTGPIYIELWTKETPKACRNFIQLCLEGYYDNTAFHRVVPGFIVQGGDPTGTGTGGESIYGTPFKDEFHNRLTFSHRGLVAMATSKQNDNRSQFFITLDKTPWLNHKHTIFGKVANDTVYNVLKIGESEVDKNDKPLVLHKIINTEVIINPFDDIQPREIQKNEDLPKNPPEPTRKSKIPKLSFVDEEEDEEASGIKSSHDILNDPKLGKEEISLEQPVEKEENKQETKEKIREDSDEEDFDEKMRKKVLQQKQELLKDNPELLKMDTQIGRYNVSTDESNNTKVTKQEDPEKEFQDLKYKLLLNLKRNPTGTNNPFVKQEEKDEEKFLSPLELRRHKYSQYKQKTKGKEKETLNKLNNFIQNLERNQGEKKWFNNKLKFNVDSTKAFKHKREDEDLVIVDPNKRLKKYQEDNDVYGKNNLEELLSHENLKKMTDS